jgi:hypothetical protein
VTRHALDNHRRANDNRLASAHADKTDNQTPPLKRQVHHGRPPDAKSHPCRPICLSGAPIDKAAPQAACCPQANTDWNSGSAIAPRNIRSSSTRRDDRQSGLREPVNNKPRRVLVPCHFRQTIRLKNCREFGNRIKRLAAAALKQLIDNRNVILPVTNRQSEAIGAAASAVTVPLTSISIRRSLA